MGTGIVCKLDAGTSAWTPGLGCPGIADEEEFGVESQCPQGDRRLKAANRHRADPNLGSSSADQWRYPVHGIAGARVHVDRGAAAIVAVETESGVGVELCALPGSGHGANLRTHDFRSIRSGVCCVVGRDVEMVDVTSNTKSCSENRAPLNLTLAKNSDGRLFNTVLPNRADFLTVHGMIQSNVADPVVADISAKRVLHVEAAYPSETPMRYLCAVDPA